MHVLTRQLGSALALLFCSAPLSAQTLRVVQIADGLGVPTDAVSPPGDERVFVTSAEGLIRVLEHGVLRQQPFLDLSGQVYPQQGLLSLAFHPGYAANGRFFVTYLTTEVEAWLVEYRVSADPNLADPSSARVLRGPVAQLGPEHSWNCVRFGPDGMLYVATGDGGATHTENPAQDLGSLNGKILRLDVDLPAPHIPPDNPFMHLPGARREIWMYGLRQPWRISFDELTGDLFIADVGLHEQEEVNFVAAAVLGGQNFGWRCQEGLLCTNFPACGCNIPEYRRPVHVYPHTAGRCAIIGGAVYRGTALPELAGAYFFADHCTGRVWSIRVGGGVVTETTEHTAELSPPGGTLLRLITSITVDAAGELLLLDRTGGRLFRVGPRPTDRFCEAAPHSAGERARMFVAGSASVSQNEVSLIARDAVAGGFGMFFYGDRRVSLPLGDGVRCAGGVMLRLLPLIPIDPSGHAALRYDLTAPPLVGSAVQPGDTWNFQFWFRDAGSPGEGFNLSDAVGVTFLP